MPYSLVLERASGTHKYSVQLKLGLLTSTCSVVCLPPQGYFNKLRLAVSEALGFISLWCLGAQRKGMVISMNVPLFLESLLILVQGMVGVFVVMAIIAIVIMLLNKLGSMKK